MKVTMEEALSVSGNIDIDITEEEWNLVKNNISVLPTDINPDTEYEVYLYVNNRYIRTYWLGSNVINNINKNALLVYDVNFLVFEPVLEVLEIV